MEEHKEESEKTTPDAYRLQSPVRERDDFTRYQLLKNGAQIFRRITYTQAFEHCLATMADDDTYTEEGSEVTYTGAQLRAEAAELASKISGE